MALEKLTLFRDNLQESAEVSKLLNNNKISKLLKENNLEVREVFSHSDRNPLLIVSGHAYSYRGYQNILKYVNPLYPSKQDGQPNQE
jgi:hypothetical protein